MDTIRCKVTMGTAAALRLRVAETSPLRVVVRAGEFYYVAMRLQG